MMLAECPALVPMPALRTGGISQERCECLLAARGCAGVRPGQRHTQGSDPYNLHEWFSLL